jgi:hypothetical protein
LCTEQARVIQGKYELLSDPGKIPPAPLYKRGEQSWVCYLLVPRLCLISANSRLVSLVTDTLDC